MGIFDFLKKFKAEKITEMVRFQDLEKFIQDKEQESKSDNKKILKSINYLLLDLIEGLKPKILDLENIDLIERKVEEKIKLIVRQNLNNYINHLKKLLVNLKNLTEEQNLEILISRINSAFANFYNVSGMNLQKATILIGKEIENTTESIGDFLRKFKDVLRKNRGVISEYQNLNQVKRKLDEFKNIEKINKQIKNSTEEIEDKLKDLDCKKKKLNGIIQKIKDSDEYKQEIKSRQGIEAQKQNLEKEIYSLKQLIDFKELANIYHANEKEMKIIKDYRENFKEAFEKDNGAGILKIINFIQKTDMDRQTINKRAEQIPESKEKIKNSEDNLNLKASADILIKESETRVLDSEIENLANQLIKEKKRFEKFEDNLKEIKNILKQHLAEMNKGLV